MREAPGGERCFRGRRRWPWRLARHDAQCANVRRMGAGPWHTSQSMRKRLLIHPGAGGQTDARSGSCIRQGTRQRALQCVPQTRLPACVKAVKHRREASTRHRAGCRRVDGEPIGSSRCFRASPARGRVPKDSPDPRRTGTQYPAHRRKRWSYRCEIAVTRATRESGALASFRASRPQVRVQSWRRIGAGRGQHRRSSRIGVTSIVGQGCAGRRRRNGPRAAPGLGSRCSVACVSPVPAEAVRDRRRREVGRIGPPALEHAHLAGGIPYDPTGRHAQKPRYTLSRSHANSLSCAAGSTSDHHARAMPSRISGIHR